MLLKDDVIISYFVCGDLMEQISGCTPKCLTCLTWLTGFVRNSHSLKCPLLLYCGGYNNLTLLRKGACISLCEYLHISHLQSIYLALTLLPLQLHSHPIQALHIKICPSYKGPVHFNVFHVKLNTHIASTWQGLNPLHKPQPLPCLDMLLGYLGRALTPSTTLQPPPSPVYIGMAFTITFLLVLFSKVHLFLFILFTHFKICRLCLVERQNCKTISRSSNPRTRREKARYRKGHQLHGCIEVDFLPISALVHVNAKERTSEIHNNSQRSPSYWLFLIFLTYWPFKSSICRPCFIIVSFVRLFL